MAWDSKSARRPQNIIATPKSAPSQISQAHVAAIVPKSHHLSDPALQPFLAPSFDAANFLNATLPPLKATTSSQISSSQDGSLAELSAETQTLLSQLSAHSTRLTNTLTQLTDEILRSGSRLAYEVEVLRGETIGLSDALSEGLREDIDKFMPGRLEQNLTRRHSTPGAGRRRSSTLTAPRPTNEALNPRKVDPEYIVKLRTLTAVRTRLDTVIKTFGDAMSWTFPPSEVSVTSAFVSVSAPEPGSEAHSIEEKGQQVSKKLRDEIADLLVGSADPLDCIEAAAKRVEELKELAIVWKGTAEEKARIRFVESLAKLVEDRHRDLLREAERDGRSLQKASIGKDSEATSPESKSQGGYGFISQLQRMRGGL